MTRTSTTNQCYSGLPASAFTDAENRAADAAPRTPRYPDSGYSNGYPDALWTPFVGPTPYQPLSPTPTTPEIDPPTTAPARPGTGERTAPTGPLTPRYTTAASVSTPTVAVECYDVRVPAPTKGSRSLSVVGSFGPVGGTDAAPNGTLRVTVRRLTLTVPNPISDSGEYRLSCTVRKGVVSHTVTVRERVTHPWYTNPTGESRAWYTTTDTFSPTEYRSLTTEEATAWLAGYVGVEAATAAITELHDGIDLSPRKPKRVMGKCACGRPEWVGSTTGKCFPCS